MSMIWPFTEFTEFEDREVTETFKIRYTPGGVLFNQYHALQVKTQPVEEGTTVKMCF
jgi:hypothetical protein